MMKWIHKGLTINLLTPEEFEELPDGQRVVSISGEWKIKGKDYIDQDTRNGHLAYGLSDVGLG